MSFSTIEELFAYLNEQGLTRVSSFLESSIEQEFNDLNSINGDIENNRKDAEKSFLEEINTFLAQEKEFDPHIIMNFRRRPKSWAIAAAISNQGEDDHEK